MRLEFQKTRLLIATVVALLLAANVATAQVSDTPKKRLRSPAVVRGYVGGESHDGYMIHARKGRVMTVRLAWQREGENRAEFHVSKSPDFFGAEPVNFGRESENGGRWSGRIPQTGVYYIYVVAHPAARYTLRVTIK